MMRLTSLYLGSAFVLCFMLSYTSFAHDLEAEYSLVPKVQVEGKVVHDDGTPASNARIKVTPSGHSSLPMESTSENDGRFTVILTPTESYTIDFETEDGHKEEVVLGAQELAAAWESVRVANDLSTHVTGNKNQSQSSSGHQGGQAGISAPAVSNPPLLRSWQGAVSGVGYIFGLFGLFALWYARTAQRS